MKITDVWPVPVFGPVFFSNEVQDEFDSLNEKGKARDSPKIVKKLGKLGYVVPR